MSTVPVRRWIDTNRVMLSNTGSLIGTTAATSGLGFIYWWLAARFFPAPAVGLASAAISAMMLLGTIGTLGLGTLAIGELSRHRPKTGAFITTSILIVGGVSVGLGVLFAVLAPSLSTELGSLSKDPAAIGLFTLGVMLTAVTVVLDQAMIGFLRSDIQLWRNALFSGVKLVALGIVGVWFADHRGLTIYATWTVGNLVSLAVLAGVAVVKGVRLTYKPELGLIRELGRTALAHHALNLALQAPGLLLPIVVTIVLSATTNSSFYVAWMIASLASIVPGHLATVLYAVGTKEPTILAQKVRTTLRLSFLFGILTSIALLVGSDMLLRLFSANYAEQAEWCLRVLGLGVFPLIIKNHYVAIRRVYGQVERAAAVMILGAGLELILGALGASVDGLTGLSLGWILAVCIEAALLVPAVYRIAIPTDWSLQHQAISPFHRSLPRAYVPTETHRFLGLLRVSENGMNRAEPNKDRINPTGWERPILESHGLQVPPSIREDDLERRSVQPENRTTLLGIGAIALGLIFTLAGIGTAVVGGESNVDSLSIGVATTVVGLGLLVFGRGLLFFYEQRVQAGLILASIGVLSIGTIYTLQSIAYCTVDKRPVTLVLIAAGAYLIVLGALGITWGIRGSTLGRLSKVPLTVSSQDTAPIAEKSRTSNRRPLYGASVYLGIVALTEGTTTLVAPQIGLTLYAIVLTALLLYVARNWMRPYYKQLLCLSIVPLIRLLSLSLPIASLPQTYWYLIISIPLFIASVLITKILGLSQHDIGINRQGIPRQLALGLTGLVFGYLQYQLQRPAPLITGMTLDLLWIPVLTLLICTGFAEELIFRGLIQRAMTESVGRFGGLYVAALYSTLYIGQHSWSTILFAFVVSLIFSELVARTHNILGVSVAHGLINITIYLVLPFIPLL